MDKFALSAGQKQKENKRQQFQTKTLLIKNETTTSDYVVKWPLHHSRKFSVPSLEVLHSFFLRFFFQILKRSRLMLKYTKVGKNENGRAEPTEWNLSCLFTSSTAHTVVTPNVEDCYAAVCIYCIYFLCLDEWQIFNEKGLVKQKDVELRLFWKLYVFELYSATVNIRVM